MLVFVIIGSFLILGIVLLVISIIKERKEWGVFECDNGFGHTGIAFIVSSCLVAMTCGIICIDARTTRSNDLTRIGIQKSIEELNSTYTYLSNSPQDITRLNIIEYNNSVRSFKERIEKKNYSLSNPWINWFIEPVYAEFTGNEVSYLK